MQMQSHEHKTAALLVSTQSIFRLIERWVCVLLLFNLLLASIFTIKVLKDGLTGEGFYPHLHLEFGGFFACRMRVCIWTSLKKD